MLDLVTNIVFVALRAGSVESERSGLTMDRQRVPSTRFSCTIYYVYQYNMCVLTKAFGSSVTIAGSIQPVLYILCNLLQLVHRGRIVAPRSSRATVSHLLLSLVDHYSKAVVAVLPGVSLLAAHASCSWGCRHILRLFLRFRTLEDNHGRVEDL
jgi:hypothetical protein